MSELSLWTLQNHNKMLAAILDCIAETNDVHMYDIGIYPCTNFEGNRLRDIKWPPGSHIGLYREKNQRA